MEKFVNKGKKPSKETVVKQEMKHVISITTSPRKQKIQLVEEKSEDSTVMQNVPKKSADVVVTTDEESATIEQISNGNKSASQKDINKAL
jgi:hypothetical protein